MCKPYLLGCCYYTLWQHTKSDCGACPYPVCPADRLKEEFLLDHSARKKGLERQWQEELRALLTMRVTECDRTAQRAKADLEARYAKAMSQCEELPEVKTLREQIAKLSTESDVAGEAGDVKSTQALMQQMETARRRVEDMSGPPPTWVGRALHHVAG